MPDSSCSITLKELYDLHAKLVTRVAVLEATEHKDIEAIIERLESRFKAHDAALKIESSELARRLEILNGEAERIREILGLTMPRELADVKLKSLNDELTALREDLVRYCGKTARATVVAMGAWGGLAALASWLMLHLLK